MESTIAVAANSDSHDSKEIRQRMQNNDDKDI